MAKIWAALSKVFGALLLVIGIGAIAGGMFAHSYVTDQLSKEKISMPSQEGIDRLQSDEAKKALQPYVDQPMTTGPQAEAFANSYVWQHMMASSGGKTYQEVSGAYLGATRGKSAEEIAANPELVKMGELRQTLFMGDTLRGMLLNAYGWWLMGTIALWAGGVMIFVGVIALILGFAVLPRKATA